MYGGCRRLESKSPLNRCSVACPDMCHMWLDEGFRGFYVLALSQVFLRRPVSISFLFTFLIGYWLSQKMQLKSPEHLLTLLSFVAGGAAGAATSWRDMEKRQFQTDAVCDTSYVWASNSKQQTPCIVAAYVNGACGTNSAYYSVHLVCIVCLQLSSLQGHEAY